MEALRLIQPELKAPKGQYNSFGKYKYRSCEDILEAAKPILAKHNTALTLSDELVLIGDRYYIKATATLIAAEGSISTTAYAREDETKKGMDGSQITGTASSYARKYALNGLFCIDDTKDDDTDENHNEQQNRAAAQQRANTQHKGTVEINNPTAADIDAHAAGTAANIGAAEKVTDAVIGQIQYMARAKSILPTDLCKFYNVKSLRDLTVAQGENCLGRLRATGVKA